MSKRTTAKTAQDIAKAVFVRKTTEGKLNKVIDAFFEGNPTEDAILHFMNEVVIHKHPRRFKSNIIKYTIKPHIYRKIK